MQGCNCFGCLSGKCICTQALIRSPKVISYDLSHLKNLLSFSFSFLTVLGKYYHEYVYSLLVFDFL
jgi:hypothetical protein